MTYAVYIDHPDGLGDYEFVPGDKYGEDVVSRKLGMKVDFICNSYGKISKGDVYRIYFDNPEDVTAFILKCEYPIINNEKIEAYNNRKNKRTRGSFYYEFGCLCQVQIGLSKCDCWLC